VHGTPPGDPPGRPYIARWWVGRLSGQNAAVCSQRSNKETPLPGKERPARSAG